MQRRVASQHAKAKVFFRWLVALNVVLLVVLVGLVLWVMMRGSESINPEQAPPVQTPDLQAAIVVDGRQRVWDAVFLPSGDLLFSERKGVISRVVGSQSYQVAAIEDVRAVGEGGLMGLAVDPQFAENRFMYACFNSSAGDVRVARWRLSSALDGLSDRKDILTGMPANTSGRHSGCRIAFGPDGNLWVVTGDAAQASHPQDPKSLGGKVLRIKRDGQPAASGNLGGEFDPRIYSYGHRNSQGIAFLKEARMVPGVSVEHGTGKDDEVNLLLPGNFGWDPNPPYRENVPMTDKQKFPDAVDAVWQSGDPTQAPSGATFVYGERWGSWQGALAVAQLKDRRIKLIVFDDAWKIIEEVDRFVGKFGRLRAAVLGPDNSLYVTTDNGENDKIIRITP